MNPILPSKRSHSGDEILVLSLNLRFGLADDRGAHAWSVRKRCFPSLFSQYPADMICLQEVNHFQADDLLQLLPSHRLIGMRSPAPRFWQNNVIFYRDDWQCLQAKHFFLSPTPGVPSRSRASRWPRQCTLGMFDCGGKRLLGISTHFDFDSQVQVESARLILAELRHWPAMVPTILAGDFNTPSQGQAYRVFIDADFQNPFSAPHPGTHHGFTGSRDGDHIDWILYRGDITPKTATVHHATIDGRYPSDHFPLLAGFHL